MFTGKDESTIFSSCIIIIIYFYTLTKNCNYYGQFALSPGKESRYIFSTVNPLNRETPVNMDIFSRGGGGGIRI